jgi:hypothetical protein
MNLLHTDQLLSKLNFMGAGKEEEKRQSKLNVIILFGKKLHNSPNSV